MKIITFLFICNLLFLTQAQATESFNSEFSHAAGGAILASGITATVERLYPEYREHRGMIGFVLSSATGIVLQSIQYADVGEAGGQLLDAASHMAGSAMGAWATDKYLLTPVIKNTANNGKYIGLAVQVSF